MYENVLKYSIDKVKKELPVPTDSRFSKHETVKLTHFSNFYEEIWKAELISCFGETDEGEQWFTISQERKHGVLTILASIFLEKNESGLTQWVYYCGPRMQSFTSHALEEVMKLQMPDGMFEVLLEKHPAWKEGYSNVIQLI